MQLFEKNKKEVKLKPIKGLDSQGDKPTWLENSEFGTITGNFSAVSSDVVVRPISTTWPSTDPACRNLEETKLLIQNLIATFGIREIHNI